MDIKETDPRLIEDLIHYFNEKKRLSIQNYTHRCSKKDEDYFREAAQLCKQHELDAAAYIELIYGKMGEQKSFFAPMHLQGTRVKHILEERKNDDSGYKVEITNSSLTPEDIWKQQKTLAMVYIKNGETSASVLMNSSLKFFAWFRILSTPDRCEPVIDKYKHIARKELTSSIIDYARAAGLDIDRILG